MTAIDTDDVRRIEPDTALIDAHPIGCDCDSGPCEGKGHAETMRREADLLHLASGSPAAGL